MSKVATHRLDEPVREKEVHRYEDDKLNVAVASMQGYRIEMEDRHIVRYK
jgi:hypothetical protein